jgi:hypothetical protein
MLPFCMRENFLMAIPATDYAGLTGHDELPSLHRPDEALKRYIEKISLVQV